MGEDTKPSTALSKQSETWSTIQSALNRLVEEVVREEIVSMTPLPSRAGGKDSADLKRTITEILGTILLETGLLERLVEKIVEKQLKSQGAAGTNSAASAPGADSLDAIRQETGKVAREFLSRHLGGLFQTEIRGVIQKEMKTILASDEIKELIDEKFRTINVYLKTEVIPKVVQQELAKAEA